MNAVERESFVANTLTFVSEVGELRTLIEQLPQSVVQQRIEQIVRLVGFCLLVFQRHWRDVLLLARRVAVFKVPAAASTARSTLAHARASAHATSCACSACKRSSTG